MDESDIIRDLNSFIYDNFVDISVLTLHYEQVTLSSNFERLPVLSTITNHSVNNNYFTEVVTSQSKWFPETLINLNVSFDDEIFSLETIVFYDNNVDLSEADKILEIDSVKAVIPKNVKLTKDIAISSEFWFIILGTIGTIAVIRLTGYLLKFSISKIIMGISDTQEFENWSKRVVFVSLMIACIVYTGYIYSVFFNQTLINFRSAVEISSTAELIKSHLTPVMSDNQYYSLIESQNSDVQQLSKKYLIRSSKEPEDCLKYMADYQNITCFIPDAEYYVNKYETEIGKSKFKILQETLGNYGISFEPFSLYYTNYLRVIIRRAKEFGLLEEINHPFVPPRNINTSPRLITKPILITVLIIGYSLSIIVFILEILKKRLRITKIVRTSKASLNREIIDEGDNEI
ncbi:uncharacterized protein LOC127286768 [Leptopilina boulardi]|uniref:uncharacterized protein LOC127286768 n=1 Tax=Leptopilina boulardi TaxID=63433 RepID=UPI0021F60D12|nr:uncharacterized protein LOC127286768 [Leptopilina boulardi]